MQFGNKTISSAVGKRLLECPVLGHGSAISLHKFIHNPIF